MLKGGRRGGSKWKCTNFVIAHSKESINVSKEKTNCKLVTKVNIRTITTKNK